MSVVAADAGSVLMAVVAAGADSTTGVAVSIAAVSAESTRTETSSGNV